MACYLSAVLPCCNEEGNVPLLREALLPQLDSLGISWELVCVDDGSRDGTAAALEALAKERPSIRVVRHPENQGLGAALRTGFSAAAGEWVVTLDADLSFPAEQIADLLAAQKETGADCVAGAPIRGRFEGVPWARRLPSRFLNRLYGLLFEPALTAYTPLFRLYRAALLRELPLRASGFEVNAEILCLLLRRGAKVIEVPATLRTRRWGASKLRRLRELSRHVRLIARLLLKR